MFTLLLLLFSQATAQTAIADSPHGTLSFSIVNAQGNPIPARLTFIDTASDRRNLFPNANADPTKLAVRDHVVYTLEGHGEITVPVGNWEVIASHGIEWSIDSTHFDIIDGEHYKWNAKLVHEIDTTNWISCDFHLHTLTHSGHGDSNMNERIISIIGEGLEFAVATDHNHNTDYQPTIDHLHANEHLTAVVGNEVSTNYGHLNIFPLDANAKVVNQELRANKLFSLIRAEKNQYGVVPIIQLNHPRWGGIDYFGKLELDPITGNSDNEDWTWNFDTIEILNENAGWGFHDAEATNLETRAGKHSVLRDWFNMLNAGRKVAAVGNSDSHTVIKIIAGIPRNYVYTGNDDAGNIDPKAVTDAIRSGRMFTTTGPFLRMTANGSPMGSTISIDEPFVDIHLDVQAASWIDLDTMRIIKNGDEVATVTIENADPGVKHFRPRIRIEAQHDCWIIAIAEGDEDMAPYVQGPRPIYPLAITNPIYIDADGDGKWTPPTEWLKEEIKNAKGKLEPILKLFHDLTPTEASLLVVASLEDHRITNHLVHLGLSSEHRIVKLAACKVAKELRESEVVPHLVETINTCGDDRYLGFLAWSACDTLTMPLESCLLLDQLTDQIGWDNVRRFADEHPLRFPNDFIRKWQIGGYFDAPKMEYITYRQVPEPNIINMMAPKTKTGGPLIWEYFDADEDGYVDLAIGDQSEHSIAYARCWVKSDEDHDVDFTIGSDDACRIWVGSELVWDDQTTHRAQPDYNRGTMTLKKGWNQVLIKILNEKGGMGFYFRILQPFITYSEKERN